MHAEMERFLNDPASAYLVIRKHFRTVDVRKFAIA